MPPILGLRGTGAFTTDERPKNWREMILFLFPNGESPLTAFLSKLKSQPTDDPEYNWWEKELPVQRVLVSGAQTSVDTTIEIVGTNAKAFVKGSVVLVESTGEIMFVSADPTADAGPLTVERGKSGTTAAAIADQAAIVIIGSVYEEGASSPSARAFAPTKLNNFTQIFRTSLQLTRTARKTKLRWDATGPYREAKREALQLHSIEMEKAFIFGGAGEDTVGGQQRRTTKGIVSHITTNKPDLGGTVTLSEWNTELEKLFRFGSTEKLGLAGSVALKVISEMAQTKGTVNLVPSDQTYGMKLIEYITPFGILYLRSHPLFNDHPVWRENILVIDVDKLVYRHVDETMFLKNRQDPGADALKDEFLTEAGLEVHHEKAHAWLQNLDTFVP